MREPVATSPPPVAIAGCGAISAVGCGVNVLLSALRANRSGLQASERFNSPRFQSSIVGAVPENFFRTDEDDPAYRLAAEALNQARGEAQPALSSIPAARIGLLLATTKANIEALERLSDGRACSDPARRHLQGDEQHDQEAQAPQARKWFHPGAPFLLSI